VSPEHRGPVELNPYLAWNFMTHGIGERPGGEVAWGVRLTANFGHDSEFGVDLDWHMLRPNLTFRRDFTGANGQTDVAVANTDVSINWFELTFTYRLRQLRLEYLTPYFSGGLGVVIFDGVSKDFVDTINLTKERIQEPITPAPVIIVAFGVDYKLDPNWAIRAEIRNEVFFTSYNSLKNNVQILDSVTLQLGVVWAFN